MLKEIIDKKEKEIKNNRNYIIGINFTFPIVGCNSNCSYCCQDIASKKPQDIDISKFIKKDFKKVLELAKNEKKNIDLVIIGGELKVLGLENQLKLVNLINELKKDRNIRRVTIVVNDTKLDSPLMKIDDVCYIVHILNWKNKKIDYKLNLYSENESINYGKKSFYKIVITDNDTLEDIKNFLKLNPNLPVNFTYNTRSEKYKDFEYMENFYHELYKLSKNIKSEYEEKNKYDFYDIKHRRYLCRHKLVKNFGFDYNEKEGNYFYKKDIRFCCTGEPYALKLDELKTLDVKKEYFEECCKNCYIYYGF